MAKQWTRAFSVVDDGIKQGHFPGAVAGIASRDHLEAIHAVGYSQIEPTTRSMQEDDIFDVASLTKPVATCSTLLKLVEYGLLSLDEPVSNFIPQWKNSRRQMITARHLLTHTSGLPAWYPTYSLTTNREQVFNYLLHLELATAPATRVEYSCIGFMILGYLIEKITGTSLANASEQLVFQPLGMNDTGYKPLERGVCEQRIVYGERDSLVEKEMLKRAGKTFDGWREGFAPGEPNDGNAAYGMGGISGNAGLYSTAADLLRFGQAYLRSLHNETGGIFCQSLAKLGVTNHTSGLNSNRSLGWVITESPTITPPQVDPSPTMLPYAAPPSYPRAIPQSGGELLSPGSFGHTGFTGTSLWIDPTNDLVMALLTNHLHPTTRTGLAVTRARFHNAVVAAKYSHTS